MGPTPLLLIEPPPLASGPPTLAVQAKCDPCLSSPCRNQGSCQNDPLQGYRCACPGGYKVSEAGPGGGGLLGGTSAPVTPGTGRLRCRGVAGCWLALAPGVPIADFLPRAETVRCPWTAVPVAPVRTAGPATNRRARMLASRELPGGASTWGRVLRDPAPMLRCPPPPN